MAVGKPAPKALLIKYPPTQWQLCLCGSLKQEGPSGDKKLRSFTSPGGRGFERAVLSFTNTKQVLGPH
jgi:hypothetical protein